jgi:hypothetical protein
MHRAGVSASPEIPQCLRAGWNQRTILKQILGRLGFHGRRVFAKTLWPWAPSTWSLCITYCAPHWLVSHAEPSHCDACSCWRDLIYWSLFGCTFAAALPVVAEASFTLTCAISRRRLVFVIINTKNLISSHRCLDVCLFRKGRRLGGSAARWVVKWSEKNDMVMCFEGEAPLLLKAEQFRSIVCTRSCLSTMKMPLVKCSTNLGR